MSQVSLRKDLTKEAELRTHLCVSLDVLTVLHGYKEGNNEFDDSLRRFPKKGRYASRVLALSGTGYCPNLKESIGTSGLLLR